MNETLSKGEIIIRICPSTGQPVLAQYEGNNKVLDLHNTSVEEDLQEVLKFLNR